MPNNEEWISLQEFMRRKKIGKEVAFQLLSSGKFLVESIPIFKDWTKHLNAILMMNQYMMMDQYMMMNQYIKLQIQDLDGIEEAVWM